MSLEQVLQFQSVANGFGYDRTEKDAGHRFDGKLQHEFTSCNHWSSSGEKGGSHERLVYLTACLIGHTVEVQVLDGSVFSGIFHATDAEKDFGIILKMAHLSGDVSGGKKIVSGSFVKQPLKTMIIPAKDLVQVIAKDVSVTRSGPQSEFPSESSEILIDSSISQSHHVNVGRELERWVPGDDEPECPELENIFDGEWNRGWDQFEVNETLFGVKSTFDEDLYTTKLEKGPQMKDQEREAVRIAKEIEGEETLDLHMAEERGIKLQANFDIDEETRFSSVFRSADDSGYNDSDDLLFDTRNYLTFVGDDGATTGGQSYAESTIWNSNDGAHASTTPPMVAALHSQPGTYIESQEPFFGDYVTPFLAGQSSTGTSPFPDRRAHGIQLGEHTASKFAEDATGNHLLPEDIELKPEGSQSSLWFKSKRSDTSSLSVNAAAYSPLANSSRGSDTCLPVSENSRFSIAQGTTHSASSTSHRQPSTSTSSVFDCSGGVSASGPRLSPSSSMGSFSLERSTLNPHAKEFKLNPSAKSFSPLQTPISPATPSSDGSFYYPAHRTNMPRSQAGPSFTAHPPVMNMINSQAAHHNHIINGPQFGQQMMIGQPQQAFYMQAYTPPEMMMYRGRDV